MQEVEAKGARQHHLLLLPQIGINRVIAKTNISLQCQVADQHYPHYHLIKKIAYKIEIPIMTLNQTLTEYLTSTESEQNQILTKISKAYLTNS